MQVVGHEGMCRPMTASTVLVLLAQSSRVPTLSRSTRSAACLWKGMRLSLSSAFEECVPLMECLGQKHTIHCCRPSDDLECQQVRWRGKRICLQAAGSQHQEWVWGS